MDININLSKPHEKQKYILTNRKKRNNICAGRRAGKTKLLADHVAITHFLKGGRVIYGAPISSQTDVFWDSIVDALRPLIEAGHLYRNKTERYIEWNERYKRDGRIRAKTAWDADSWRGDWGDLLIYDEFAFMKEEAWSVVGVPMLLDNGGEAWFISTPNRKNHFYAHYIRGLNEDDDRWASFHFTSHDNPYLSQEALSEISADMTDDDYRQEILAEFLENEGAVFRNIDACLNAPYTTPEKHKGHRLVCGVDWGKKKDYTVMSIGCLDCRCEVDLIRFNQIDYIYQRDRIKNAWVKWGVYWGFAEENSIGAPNLEDLQHDGLTIDGFQTTAISKPQIIESLKLTLEREQFQFLPDKIARAELESYELTISERTGRPSYNAPTGTHDDTVIARALLNHAVNSYQPAFL